MVLGAVLRIESELSCPDPAEVTANVQNLLYLSDESAAGLRAAARKEDGWLVLSLTGPDGASLGERRVAYDGDCPTLARAAAVVFAAWISSEHPEFLVALPPASTRSPTELDPDAAPALAPAVAPAPSTAAPVAPAAPASPPVRSAPVVSVPLETRRRLVLGAGVGGASSPSFAPGLALSAADEPASGGWGARVSAAWLGSRTEPLSGHRVSWTRWPLMAGPFLRLRAGRAAFDLEAGGALGWTRLHGRGFETDATDSGISVGGYAALRFVPRPAPQRLFMMAAPIYWFQNATAAATDATSATQTRTLPPFEVLLILGLEFTP